MTTQDVLVNQLKERAKKIKSLLSAGDTNAKTAKNEVKTFILYLAPANSVPGLNVCPWASEGCTEACLYTAGRGKFTNVQFARMAKTQFWADDRPGFYKMLAAEIIKEVKKARANGYPVAFRLNGTSDIDHLGLLSRFAGVDFVDFDGTGQYGDVMFYDYTKSPKQVTKYAQARNYKLTFSRAENNEAHVMTALAHGVNVAAVFAGELPDTWNGYPVINGDLSDFRFNDPAGVIVGLKAKGDAKKDKSGFVIQSNKN